MLELNYLINYKVLPQQIQTGDSVYDPACGTGGMLLECVEYVKAQKGEYRTLRLYGRHPVAVDVFVEILTRSQVDQPRYLPAVQFQ